jgi:hypothetical protein
MDTMANLLVILFCLSALYTALGVLEAGIEDISRRVATWRRWRPAPSIQRRPHRAHPRRRTERNGPGSVRRPVASGKVPAQVLRTL